MPNATDDQFLSSAFYSKDPLRHCQDLTQPPPRNEAAWAALVNRLDQYFVRYARSWGLSEEAIEDIMQDTIMLFMADIDSGKFKCTGYSPITYVGKICRNLHLSYHKRMKKELLLSTDISQYVGEHDERQASMLTEHDTTLEDYCARKAIQQAIDEQPEEHQGLLWEFYADDRQLKDLAAEKGYTEGYMRIKKMRILKPFRVAFHRYFNTCLSNG